MKTQVQKQNKPKGKPHDPGHYSLLELNFSANRVGDQLRGKKKLSCDARADDVALQVEDALIAIGADFAPPVEALAKELCAISGLTQHSLRLALAKLAEDGRLLGERIASHVTAPLKWRLRLYRKPTGEQREACRACAAAFLPRPHPPKKKAHA
jgi:hypothetical protein